MTEKIIKGAEKAREKLHKNLGDLAQKLSQAPKDRNKPTWPQPEHNKKDILKPQ